ncbi:uncharacterized protein LOC114339288 [Diabrotica virgifera virgifera]|uniref:Uncharacterized protein n=1 Tax=Diabrotica virgifera virgifera TaxID=50390 RepID=A0ABM5LA79_DIAVI|nr:uncharacterized protein LOC114339288 [Diabrotica virgifera virgifera]
MLPSAPLAYPVIEGVDDDELENSSKFSILSNILLENEEILENEENNEKVENAEGAKNNELDERIGYVVDETLADELDHKPLNLKNKKQQQKVQKKNKTKKTKIYSWTEEPFSYPVDIEEDNFQVPDEILSPIDYFKMFFDDINF